MDTQSPHNIMLMQVSAEEYETALSRVPPVRVSSFGYLAGQDTPPPTDDFGRNVYWLYVCIGNNHYRAEFRMSVEEFNNVRIWQFAQRPTKTGKDNVVQAKRKQAVS